MRGGPTAVMLAVLSSTTGCERSDPPRTDPSPLSTAASPVPTVRAPEPRPSASVAMPTPAAPVDPDWGASLPGITTRLPKSDTPQIALTLDACGGPGGDGYDRELVELLVRESIPATLFLSARWIKANPTVASELAGQPLFVIENHGATHRPCSVTGKSAFGIPGTASETDAREEVLGGQNAIEVLTRRPPRFFRPATGHYDARCLALVQSLRLTPVGYTVAADGGAAFSRKRIASEIERAVDGSIVLLHMNHPNQFAAEGLADALPAVLARGTQFVTLATAFPGPAPE